VGAAPGGGAKMPFLVSGLSLVQWMGMKLDTFDGIDTPVEAADWLTYVEDKGSCSLWHTTVEGRGSDLVERHAGNSFVFIGFT
jgi:formylglycine-generating enzyme required for sulfatase activity